MNIGQLKNILGEAVSNEARTLELRVGQVVRGVVAQHLNNNEALVNINGVQVRAKLEIPLMEGQAALMQVHPDSKGSQIILKQVDPTTLGFSDPMKDILRAMGLPDKQWAIDVIRQLRADGVALNKQTTAAFQRMVAAMPQGMNMEQWIQAASIAVKRGLPMTEATLLGIHQLMNGPSIHNLMEQFRGQLQALLTGASPSQQNAGNQLWQPLVQQLAQSLQQGQQLMQQLAGGGEGQSSAQQTSQSAAMIQQPIANMQTGQHTSAETGSNSANQQFMSGAQLPSGAIPSNSLLAQLFRWLGVDYEQMLGKQMLSPQDANTAMAQSSHSTLAPSAQNMQQQAQQQLATQSQATNGQSGLQTLGNQAAAASNTQAGQLQGNPVTLQSNPSTAAAASSSMLQPSTNSVLPQSQPLTSSVQSQQMQATAQTSNTTFPQESTTTNTAIQQQAQLQGNVQQSHVQPVAGGVLQSQLGAEGNIQQAFQTNLKASLLQLLKLPDVPAAIKETAQQLVNAITGQQLMLATERNNGMFSHMMFYIPLQSQDGSHTAKVHIQTRRDRKGAVDADNCRLVFDLSMKTIGATLVDVHITSKVISLHVWNDHPAIGTLATELKPAMLEGLNRIGYTLSSLRVTPLEERTPEVAGEKEVPPPIESFTSAKRYKGVDIKA